MNTVKSTIQDVVAMAVYMMNSAAQRSNMALVGKSSLDVTIMASVLALFLWRGFHLADEIKLQFLFSIHIYR